MLFGLSNAPATFQSLMNQIFRVYSVTLEEHLKYLDLVLSVLRHHELFANQKKCLFARKQVEHLGHLVSSAGVKADPSKIVAMENWPTPRTLKELRGFLGHTGYYRRFMAGYGSIAWPFTQQLKKDSFCWNEEAERAFVALKRAMTTIPILALLDFTKLFVIEIDASGYGLGAVLMQEGKPIAYFSQTSSDRARLRSVYERELMAIVLAVQKWRHYVIG